MSDLSLGTQPATKPGLTGDQTVDGGKPQATSCEDELLLEAK